MTFSNLPQCVCNDWNSVTSAQGNSKWLEPVGILGNVVSKHRKEISCSNANPCPPNTGWCLPEKDLDLVIRCLKPQYDAVNFFI